MADRPTADHLALEHALQANPGLTKELMDAPDKVLERFGATEDALTCPPAAHDALERGKAAADAIAPLGSKPFGQALPAAARLIRERFGADAIIEKRPFGIRFAEQVKGVSGLDWTATGSGTITFSGWDSDSDVDG